jgi:chemotaxis protein MotB
VANGGKKKGRADKDVDTQAWMVTFSDLSTLLLTFFVLLLSMSSMNELKMKSMFHNFNSSCGILGFKEYGEIAHPKDSLIRGLAKSLKDALIVRRDEDQGKTVDIPAENSEQLSKGASGSLVFQEIKGGFKLIFGEKLLFDSGSAEIRDRARPILEKIARFMRRSSYQIYIDGYTDNVPIHTEKYASNRALSLARAYSVMNYFVTDEKLPPEGIALGAYGASRPVASNDSIVGRAKNRRVEMIFKNQKYF